MSKKYVERLQSTKEDKEKAFAGPRADEQRARLALKRKELEIIVLGAKNRLDELKSVYPLNCDQILQQADVVALGERQLKQLDEIDAELFGA